MDGAGASHLPRAGTTAASASLQLAEVQAFIPCDNQLAVQNQRRHALAGSAISGNASVSCAPFLDCRYTPFRPTRRIARCPSGFRS
ncbi:hypothetical protein GCM10010095_82790 [Streptomyces anthocyanicus]|uniref:Uncharacterized protein n=1 Tax=Streptomyces violaceolatus TaxID=67378 RepID=A0ABN3TGI8_9ACTN|nr:hypothetical protein GCM10010095_82790 [Streptomyces anthocyanicus]GHC38765.1 hypothetical protein GCM10010348_77650 [Streptomyces anthocyanicus]